MNSEDGTPPFKRRRTSTDSSTGSPRQQSRTRDGISPGAKGEQRRQYSASRSRSRSRQSASERQRSTSNDNYATPRSRYSTPPADHGPSSKLTFLPLFHLPHTHLRGITTVKFSPDCSLLATGSADGTIKIYNVPATPNPDQPFPLLRTLRAHLAGINALTWSPLLSASPTLASASDDKSILLWSPLSSDFPIAPSPLLGHHNYVYSLAFSPKGNMLASGSHDEAVYLWDVRSGRIMRQLPAHSDPVGGVDFIRDGTMVVSCAGDGLIRIWDSATGQCLKTLVHEDRKPVMSVKFSPNGRFVLAWTLDGAVRLWRYMGSGGDCVKTYQGHVNERYSLSGCIGTYSVVDEDRQEESEEAFVVSGSEDGDVVVWDVNTKEELWRGKAHKDVVLSVDWARCADGRGLLASVGKDKDLRVWIEDSPAQVVPASVESEKEVAGHVVKMEIKREDTEMNDATN